MESETFEAAEADAVGNSTRVAESSKSKAQVFTESSLPLNGIDLILLVLRKLGHS